VAEHRPRQHQRSTTKKESQPAVNDNQNDIDINNPNLVNALFALSRSLNRYARAIDKQEEQRDRKPEESRQANGENRRP
jgi:hypothetical protein